jgi:hypothetical protein
MAQMIRAKTVVENLIHGAPTYQKSSLPSLDDGNCPSAIEYGKDVTDCVATWVKSGFAAGPFKTPPLKNFRCNSLMAVPQDNKVRPVLNVSSPKGRSMNDNIDLTKLETVRMTSAKAFGYSICEAGEGAIMSKFDIVAAYKQMPAKLEDYRLQGFRWLNRFFIETKQIFGAITSVANFDQLGRTILDLTLSKCKIPRKLVHRQLDDVPVVAPAGSGMCEEFSKVYREICETINIPLAPDCPNRDKAFTNETSGKVLGIEFNTVDLTWRLPEAKRQKVLRIIGEVQAKEKMDLHEMQVLMGNLNNVGMMSPVLKSFKRPLNDCLAYLQENETEKISLSKQAKRDLGVWAAFLLDEKIWNPIPPRPCAPTLSHLTFVSDAAGSDENAADGFDKGVGCLGLDENGSVILVHQTIWPEGFLDSQDGKGVRMGDKTSTLEIIGVVIPFLLMPKKFLNQNVVLLLDNISVVYAWENHSFKNDICASIFVRALRLIGLYLSCNIHVQHVKRMTTWEARLADQLSRTSSTGRENRRRLANYSHLKLPSCIVNWLHNPIEDWDLCMTLLNHIINN